MLALKRSLLKREVILINVLMALASVISMCSLHVILLSKITLRYFTWLTEGIFRPFNVIWASGELSPWAYFLFTTYSVIHTTRTTEKTPRTTVLLLYTYISVSSAAYYLVTLLPHYIFRQYTAIIRCCLSCYVALYVKITYRVWTRYFLIKIN
jgi:hypothetical protein